MEDATVALGSRKHLFIDLTLVERRDHVELRVNPPRLGGVAITCATRSRGTAVLTSG